MADRERRCRQCTACKTAKCRKGTANACSACRNPAIKKGCVLRDPCLHYDQGAATDGNNSVCDTSGDELAFNAQKSTFPNTDSCDSGVDERVQLSQFIDKTILNPPPLEVNLPKTPPRLLEATKVQDTISRIESPNTVVKKPSKQAKFVLPLDKSWEYDLDNVSMTDSFTSQRRESNYHIPAMAASTPAKTGQHIAFTPQFQPIQETTGDETLQGLISTLNDFLIRVHPHQEAEINSVMNGMNAVDHSDQSCLIGVFCQVIKKIHGYKSDVDVTQLAGMYLDLYRRTINLLDEDQDWDNPTVASPLLKFGVDMAQLVAERLSDHAEQQEMKAASSDPSNLTVYIPPLGYEGIPAGPQEKRRNTVTQEKPKSPEKKRHEEERDVFFATPSEEEEYEQQRAAKAANQDVQESAAQPINQEANVQQTSSPPVQVTSNQRGHFYEIVRALQEIEFEMIHIRGTYYGSATLEQAQAMQAYAQELHTKLTNIGLYFNQVGNILMLPRQQKIMDELVIHKGFVDRRLVELRSATIQGGRLDQTLSADPALGIPNRVDSAAPRSIVQTIPSQANLLTTIATTSTSIATSTTTTQVITTTCGTVTSHSRSVMSSRVQNPAPDGRPQGLDKIVSKACQEIPDDVRTEGMTASMLNQRQPQAVTPSRNHFPRTQEPLLAGINPFVISTQEFPVDQQRVVSPDITPQLHRSPVYSQTNLGGNTLISTGASKETLARKEVSPGFNGPPTHPATHYANRGLVSERNVGANTLHSGANGGNTVSSGDGNSGRGSQRVSSSRNGGSSDGNNSLRDGNAGRGSQRNPNSHGGGSPDDDGSPGRPDGNGSPFRGPPPGGPPGSGFPNSGPPSPPRDPPSSTNDRRREHQSNRCFRNVIRLVKEGIDLHQRIRAELSECFRKSKENDDLQTLSILNTILPGIVEEAGILRECTKHLTKELNYADFDTEFADNYITGFDNVIREVSQYKAKLTRLVSVNQLDRKTEANKILGEQKMEKFAGWDGGQIIHDYLRNLESYFHLGGVSKDKDMGVLLYSRMLSSHVKVQMNEHKDSYAAMKKALLRCYGDPKQILKIQLDKLGKIKFPIKDDMKSEIIYLRQFHSELKRIQDLVEELGRDTALGLEFYREGCFVDILTILGIGYRPVYKEWSRREYTRLKIREEEKGSMYHYSVYYNKFLKFIEDFWKSIEIQINLRRGNQLFGKSKPRWSDPLGTKPDGEKQSKGEKPKNIGHLKSYLESQRSNLPDEAYSKMSKMIDGIHTTETPEGNPKKTSKQFIPKMKNPAPDDFDKKCKLRCFVCPLTANPHELATCKTGLEAGNKERRIRAINLGLCITCLRRDCRKRAEETSVYWTCENRQYWLGCAKCTNEATNSKAVNRSSKNSWSPNILVCTRHTINLDPDLLKRLVSRLGTNPKVNPIFIMNSTSKATNLSFVRNHAVEVIPSFQEVDKLVDDQGAKVPKGTVAQKLRVPKMQGDSFTDVKSTFKQNKGGDAIPKPARIPAHVRMPQGRRMARKRRRELKKARKARQLRKAAEKESRRNKERITFKLDPEHRKCKLYAEEKGIVYNSETGAKIQLTEDMEIKEESTEDTLYYFQMIRIGGYTLLLFYDSGASIGIILGKIAEMLKLEILDTRQQEISGAADMLHRSPYGKYGMTIGPLSDGSYHKLSLTGLQQITDTIPSYDMTSLADEARAFSNELGLKFIESVYPTKVGGNAAGMVLGMRTPHLLPKEQFILPSGLIVARTEIVDVYGSRVVFGGTAAQITQANKIAGVYCGSLEGQKFFHTEYLVYKDSINGNQNLTQKSNGETQGAAGSPKDDNKANSIKSQCSNNTACTSSHSMEKLKPRSVREFEAQSVTTVNMFFPNSITKKCNRDLKMESKFQNTSKLRRNAKRDTDSETTANSAMKWCPKTKSLPPKGVKDNDSSPAKPEYGFNLTLLSEESKVEQCLSLGKSEKYFQSRNRINSCEHCNISQHQVLKCECEKSVVVFQDVHVSLGRLNECEVFGTELQIAANCGEKLDKKDILADCQSLSHIGGRSGGSKKDFLCPAHGIPNRVDSAAPRQINKELGPEQSFSKRLIFRSLAIAKQAKCLNFKSYLTKCVERKYSSICVVKEFSKRKYSYSTRGLNIKIDIQQEVNNKRFNSGISNFRTNIVYRECHVEPVYPTSRGGTLWVNPTSAGGSTFDSVSPTSAGGSAFAGVNPIPMRRCENQTQYIVSGTDHKTRREALKLFKALERRKLCDQVSISDTGLNKCKERQLKASTCTMESHARDSKIIHSGAMLGSTKIHNQKTKATAKDGKLKEELSLKGDNSVDEIEASPVRKSSSGNVGLDSGMAQDLAVSTNTSLRHSKKCLQREFSVIC